LHADLLKLKMSFEAESHPEKVSPRSARKPAPVLKLLCIGMAAAVLAATLWPFNPFPKNRVHWLQNQNGLRFAGKGIVRSAAPFPESSLTPATSCTLQVVVWPALADEVHTFLSFYSGKNKPQLELRQYLDGVLLFGTIRDAGGKLRRVELDADRVLRKEQPSFLAFSSGPHGTTVYVNGKIVEHASWYQLSLADFQGELILGTSPVDHDPWSGKFLGLGIFAKELSPAEIQQSYEYWQEKGKMPGGAELATIRSYSFGERNGPIAKDDAGAAPALNIPTAYSIPYKSMLKPFWREYSPDREYVNDLIRNVAGFMPLGFLLAAYFSKKTPWPKAILAVMLCGGLLSLTIEVLQAFIPERNSGTTDILTNTAGAVLGAMAWKIATEVFKKTEV
jgi:VanZ family protein